MGRLADALVAEVVGMRRMFSDRLWVGAVVLAPLVVLGCNLIMSDEYKWRGLWVANETLNPVLVESSKWGWRFVVEPGQKGQLWAGSHPFPTELEFLTAECLTIDHAKVTGTEDTLMIVTTSGVNVVTDPSPASLNSEVLPEASPWPCDER